MQATGIQNSTPSAHDAADRVDVQVEARRPRTSDERSFAITPSIGANAPLAA